MARFTKGQSIADFQKFAQHVYGMPDDRYYSLWDLLVHEQRFVMRALKGIRKENKKKVALNLAIAFAWLMTIAGRLHIEIEDEVWQRFPYLCSYCGHAPCACKTIRPEKRLKVKINNTLRPHSVSGFQKMFQEIYPAESRTPTHAGMHLAEEIGEITEAIQNFLGHHYVKQFEEVKLEMADCISCIFGVANSAQIDLAKTLAEMFSNNCHVCHKVPCECGFNSIALIKT